MLVVIWCMTKRIKGYNLSVLVVTANVSYVFGFSQWWLLRLCYSALWRCSLVGNFRGYIVRNVFTQAHGGQMAPSCSLLATCVYTVNFWLSGMSGEWDVPFTEKNSYRNIIQTV
jgi:hypothetical protein